MIRIIMCAGSLWLCPTVAYAGAWAMPDGETQIISTTVYSSATSQFDETGKLSIDTVFKKVDAQFYLEYGITPKLTLVAATAYQDIDYVGRNGFERFNGFGETQLGLRYNFHASDKWQLAAQVSGLVGGPGETVPDADLGNGGNGLELRGLAGHSFVVSGKKGFADVQGAWRYRGGNDPNDWRLSATVGVETRDDLKFIGQIFYNNSGAALLDIDRVRDNESLKLSLSAVYTRSERRSYQIGVFQTVWGKNIVREKALIAGVWEKF